MISKWKTFYVVRKEYLTFIQVTWCNKGLRCPFIPMPYVFMTFWNALAELLETLTLCTRATWQTGGLPSGSGSTKVCTTEARWRECSRFSESNNWRSQVLLQNPSAPPQTWGKTFELNKFVRRGNSFQVNWHWGWGGDPSTFLLTPPTGWASDSMCHRLFIGTKYRNYLSTQRDRLWWQDPHQNRIVPKGFHWTLTVPRQ